LEDGSWCFDKLDDREDRSWKFDFLVREIV
jgi:hypothetical protein